MILEPTAVADVLMSLGWYGFNAKAVEERVSFVRVGEAQFDPAVTLVDDAPAAGDAFDAEGTPTRRTTLIDAGTTASLTHDLRTAAVVGAESTGHGVGAPSFGALARHLCLAPSDAGAGAVAEVDGPIVDAAAAELVAGVERGILVTDLWYTRVLDPRTLVVTGLTRNGVWLVEGGEVVQALRNFRFTQSYAQALMPGSVRGVGRVAHAVPGDTYTRLRASLDGAGAAPRVVELHRRRQRLATRAHRADGCSVGTKPPRSAATDVGGVRTVTSPAGRRAASCQPPNPNAQLRPPTSSRGTPSTTHDHAVGQFARHPPVHVNRSPARCSPRPRRCRSATSRASSSLASSGAATSSSEPTASR